MKVIFKTEMCSEHFQTFKTKRFGKTIMSGGSYATRNFSGQGGGGRGIGPRRFNKHFVKNTRKGGGIFLNFSPR